MADVVAMVDYLGRLIDGSEDASRRILSGNASWNDHLLAALMAPVQRPINPDQQLICHAVAARCLHQGKLTEFAVQPFLALVTDAWLDRCDSPAQLVTPRLTVPAIRRAATSTAAGWQRVLAVLEESRHAVSASTSSSLNEILDELRKARPLVRLVPLRAAASSRGAGGSVTAGGVSAVLEATGGMPPNYPQFIDADGTEVLAFPGAKPAP